MMWEEDNITGFIDEIIPTITPKRKERVEGYAETVRIPKKSAEFLYSMLETMDMSAFFSDNKKVADAKTARNDLRAQLYPTKPVKNMKPFSGPRERKRGRPRV